VSDTDDLKVRREIYALCGQMGVFDPPPDCAACGCSVREHVPIRRNGGLWGTVCRNCPCDSYVDESEPGR
jgi:hypothetical protein